MKLMKFLLTAIVAFSSTFSLAENMSRYKFSGNSFGKQVCRAIVNDDVKDLRRVLHLHRRTLVYAYAFSDPAGRALVGSFTCNGKELQEFSHSVGAQQILGFLTKGTGIVEEQVVATER